MSALALLLIHALLTAPAAAGEEEALWQAAVRLAATSRGWVAGRVVITVEELDESGWPTSSKQVTRLFPAAPGGREAAKAARVERAPAAIRVRTGPDPFLDEVQAGLERVALEARRSIGGVACVGFRYAFREPGGPRQAGEAWLSAEDGRPVELRYRLHPAPAGLAEVSVHVRFTEAAAGAFRRANMVIEARRASDDERSRATFVFQDYWRR